MVIIIWDWTGLGNCRVNWGQFRPTSVRLIISTSSLPDIFRITIIYHHITQSPLHDNKFYFSLNIHTTREAYQIISWVKWVCKFSLWFFSTTRCTIPPPNSPQIVVWNGQPSVFDNNFTIILRTFIYFINGSPIFRNVIVCMPQLVSIKAQKDKLCFIKYMKT